MERLCAGKAWSKRRLGGEAHDRDRTDDLFLTKEVLHP